jgi:hypothetical protein
VFVVVGGYGGSSKTFREGDKATIVHGGGNKAGRFLEVLVLTEGGRKSVIWLSEGHFGRGWWHFVGELRHLLAAQSKLLCMAKHGASSLVGPILDAPFSGVVSRRSFVDVLRSFLGVEAIAIDFKGCFSRPFNLFPVSSCFESESDGLGVHFTVDCSALESLSTPLAAAAGSVCLRKRKKGKLGISGLLRLLGQIQHKLDRVRVGLASKPNCKRKRVRFLGLTKSGVGWVSGLVLEAGLDQNSGPGQFSNPGHNLDPGQNLDLSFFLFFIFYFYFLFYNL